LSRPRADTLVLCYHAVGAGRSLLEISAELLDRQLRWLMAHGYTGATFSEALRRPGRVLSVTFDDASATVRETGAPVLRRLGLAGTVFVPVDSVGAPGVLGWDELRALAEEGWEIGSHTIAHLRLPTVADAELDEQLRGSRAAIEEALGRPCRSLAYPHGEVDERVVRAAAAAGYEAACLVGDAGALRGALACPRVGLSSRDGWLGFRLKVSPAVRQARRSNLVRPLESLARRARDRRGAAA
jgi:peptidoglycan/xylan/chitin deacetylase (PgdA/CDA1 family)